MKTLRDGFLMISFHTHELSVLHVLWGKGALLNSGNGDTHYTYIYTHAYLHICMHLYIHAWYIHTYMYTCAFTHRCKKTLTRRIKKTLKPRFYEKVKKTLKMFNKKRCDKWTKLFKPNEKVSSKITLLVSYSVHDNVSELWLLIREFTIVAMLNPSLKSRFI